MTTLAELVAEARSRKTNRQGKPWTQQDLADAMGVSRGYIGQVETSLVKRPRPKYQKLFMQTLDIAKEDWLRATGELGPASQIDLAAEIRRIDAIPDFEDQVSELEQLETTHPELLRLMESMALHRVRRAFRPDQE